MQRQTPDPSLQANVTVATRIREALGGLPAKERLVARALLAQYPTAGLNSADALARAAEVSAPTVARFVTRMGFRSFKDFQSELRAELVEQLAAPHTLKERSTLVSSSEQLGSTGITDNLSQTFHQLPEEELEKATRLLSGAEGSLHIFGGRFTHILADYAALNFRVIRKNVHYYHNSADAIAASLDAGRGDCLLVFDVRRYQAESLANARLFREKRVPVVLVTDPWLSPIAEFASAVLPARVEGASPLDSLVGALGIVELLTSEMYKMLGAKAEQRIDHWEQANLKGKPV